MSERLKIVVCVKQTPMATELPWNPKTGALMRESAEGMINPACRSALEAAIQLKERHGAEIIAISMGPAQAEEALREAVAMGADRAALLCDPAMAGADTLSTSYTLGCAIRTIAPDFNLALCGCHTSDSETAQVGPQLAEELGVPGASYVDTLEIVDGALRMTRLADDFLETLEAELPALATITERNYKPRKAPLGGVELAFSNSCVSIMTADDIGADRFRIGAAGAATKILRVYSPVAEKKGIVMKGTPKKIVDQLLEACSDRIGAAIGRDLARSQDNKHGRE